MHTSTTFRGLTLVTVGLALALGACSKSDDASKPTGVPPMANPPPPAAPAPTPPPPAPTPPPAAPAPAPVAEKPADPNAKITGTVVLAGAMKKNVAPTDTLYIVARRVPDNPTARGTLIAVKKLAASKFPMEFELSAADMPFQTGAFEGELQLSARVDKDGDPMTRLKGDVFGMLPKVKVGAKNVKLPLDQLQKEDESLAQPGANPHGGPMGGGGMPPGHP